MKSQKNIVNEITKTIEEIKVEFNKEIESLKKIETENEKIGMSSQTQR